MKIKNILTIIMASTLIIMGGGCISLEQKINNKLQGTNMDSIFEKLGGPDSSIDLQDGTTVHTYKNRSCRYNYKVDEDNLILRITMKGC